MSSTILIADDHILIRNGLEQYLINKGYEVVASCDNGKSAYKEIIKHNPTIAFLDLDMPLLSGLEVAARLTNYETKIVLLSLHKEPTLITRASSLNLHGYILKESALEEIDKCIQSICHGEKYFSKALSEALGTNRKVETLTPSELRILTMIRDKQSTRDIAKQLQVSERTVEKHRSNMQRKLELKASSNSLYIWAVEHLL